MPIDYIAYNQAGARVVGVVEEGSVEEAEQHLWSAGLLVVQLRQRKRSEERSTLAHLFPSLFGARLRDVVIATRQLETLLRAGVALPVALRQLRDQTRNPGFRDTLRDIVRDIEGGERFSRACARHPRVFPSYYLRLLPMAEETGDLPSILNGLLRTMERQQLVGTQAKRAVVTPIISLVVALLAGVVLFTFVLPRLVVLLGEFGGKLPLPTRMLMAVASFGETYGVITLFSLVAILGATGLYFSSSRQGTRIKDRMLLKLPLVSSVVLTSTMFDVCSTLSLLLRAGVAPVTALRALTTMVGNQVVQDALIHVEALVTQGEHLGKACQGQPGLPPLFSDTVSNGEQAGSLRQNMEALTDYYQGETERAISQVTSLIEPALILLVGGIIGFIAIGIISGIYSVIPQISSNI